MKNYQYLLKLDMIFEKKKVWVKWRERKKIKFLTVERNNP